MAEKDRDTQEIQSISGRRDGKVVSHETQQLYFGLQVLDRQMKQLQQNLQAVQIQAVELDYVQQSLEEFKNVEQDEETLIPIASGIFAKGRLKDAKELIVNVGGNTLVAKSIDDTKNIINQRVEELRKMERDLAKELQRLAEKSLQTEQELRKVL